MIFHGPLSLTGWSQGTGFCAAHPGLSMSSGDRSRVVEASAPDTDPGLETNWAFSNETVVFFQDSSQARYLSKDEFEGKKIKQLYSSSSLCHQQYNPSIISLSHF